MTYRPKGRILAELRCRVLVSRFDVQFMEGDKAKMLTLPKPCYSVRSSIFSPAMMFDAHDAHNNASQPDATIPPSQPVYGYRCGSGCGGSQEGDGGSREDDAASTLVASDESDVGEVFPDHTADTGQSAGFDVPTPPPAAAAYTDEFLTRMERFISAEDAQHAIEINNQVLHSSQMGMDQDMDSMWNEPDPDGHSDIASRAASARCISPGPGLGAWADDYHLEYHFVVRPLRLTPQHRYCRGLVASHLVLRDEDIYREGEDGLHVNGRLHQA